MSTDAPCTEQQDPMCFVGRCKCGGIMFAAVDLPEYRKDTAKSVADCIRRGFTIERAALDVPRTGKWCTNSKEHMRG